MEKFTVLKGVAAPMPLVNIDTDAIMPKQFLKTIQRTGLGKSIFFDDRYDNAGKEKPDFLLNKEPFRHAKILIAGNNFGCGSSREHAPWGLLDFGFRAIISSAFADIFYNNCFKNGILPIILPQAEVDRLLALADKAGKSGGEFTVDLTKNTIIGPDGSVTKFELDATKRHNLLNGLDDIGLTLQHLDKIKAFEAKQKSEQPWLQA
jgi:3-isopropylmalate/(R)-2-methylmalate dehydratase small subunit